MILQNFIHVKFKQDSRRWPTDMDPSHPLPSCQDHALAHYECLSTTRIVLSTNSMCFSIWRPVGFLVCFDCNANFVDICNMFQLILYITTVKDKKSKRNIEANYWRLLYLTINVVCIARLMCIFRLRIIFVFYYLNFFITS